MSDQEPWKDFQSDESGPWEDYQQPAAPAAKSTSIGDANVGEAGAGTVGLAETAAHLGTGALSSLAGGLTYLGTLAATRNPDAAQSVRDDTEQALTYAPRTEEGKGFVEGLGEMLKPVVKYVKKGAEGATQSIENAFGPAAGAIAGAGFEALPTLAGAGPEMALGKRILQAAEVSTPKIIETVGKIGKTAAQEAPKIPGKVGKVIGDIGRVEPSVKPLQNAPDEGTLNMGNPLDDASPEAVMQRHQDAQRHGITLMKGQATRNPLQFTDEQNSVLPELTKHKNAQEAGLINAFDNIRRKYAGPAADNDVIQNGQTIVDALKEYDEPIRANIDAKYQAARDASANGELHMDGSGFVDAANAALKPQSKFRFLPPNVKAILDDVSANQGKMTLDDFEAYSTQLGNEIAKARMSGDGNVVTALKKVNDALQGINPVGTETTQAKALFDDARAAAKARFKAIESDPAYGAAVADVSKNGVKAGAPSDLADNFVNKYVIGLKRASLERLVPKLSPEARQALVGQAMDNIRNKAITKAGKTTAPGFTGAMNSLGPKADLLLSPEALDDLQSLNRTFHNVNTPPAAHAVNYSKSGVLSNAAQNVGEGVLNAKTHGFYGLVVNPAMQKFRERKFVNQALAPNAGVEPLPNPKIQRASGGKVAKIDEEFLINRLLKMAKKAKKVQNKSTEHLLNAKDESIIKALEVAQKAI